jgi:hypothetical protein
LKKTKLAVSKKTDSIIELEPHSGQVFPPARDYEALSHQPLQGAEAAIAKKVSRKRAVFSSAVGASSL